MQKYLPFALLGAGLFFLSERGKKSSRVLEFPDRGNVDQETRGEEIDIPPGYLSLPIGSETGVRLVDDAWWGELLAGPEDGIVVVRTPGGTPRDWTIRVAPDVLPGTYVSIEWAATGRVVEKRRFITV